MEIYLDNAATTPLDPTVLLAMTPYLLENFGNPSSLHGAGRKAKAALETSRKRIAALLNAQPEEIIFTSGGTEADNIAIVSAVTCNGIDHVITTRFEHAAVLQTLKALNRQHNTCISFIEHDERGNLDLNHLEYLLRTNTRNLVSVMHANNEVGNLNDIARIGQLCKKYDALFHTDTVQTIGHYNIDVGELNVDFLTASAHKFHGPKGVGFLYCRSGRRVTQLVHGGGQEGGLRAGTENVPSIVGMAHALESAYAAIDADKQHIQSLKAALIAGLLDAIPGISFNGNSGDLDNSLYTVLSVCLPEADTELLHYLYSEGVAVSGGSACSGGKASHVLRALGVDGSRTTVRFSFSKYNTLEEIELVTEKLAAVYSLAAA